MDAASGVLQEVLLHIYSSHDGVVWGYRREEQLSVWPGVGRNLDPCTLPASLCSPLCTYLRASAGSHPASEVLGDKGKMREIRGKDLGNLSDFPVGKSDQKNELC